MQSPAAVDLSANTQSAGLDYVFTTTDGTPPSLTTLVQQVVGNAAWAQDNAIVFLVTGTGTEVEF